MKYLIFFLMVANCSAVEMLSVHNFSGEEMPFEQSGLGGVFPKGQSVMTSDGSQLLVGETAYVTNITYTTNIGNVSVPRNLIIVTAEDPTGYGGDQNLPWELRQNGTATHYFDPIFAPSGAQLEVLPGLYSIHDSSGDQKGGIAADDPNANQYTVDLFVVAFDPCTFDITWGQTDYGSLINPPPASPVIQHQTNIVATTNVIVPNGVGVPVSNAAEIFIYDGPTVEVIDRGEISESLLATFWAAFAVGSTGFAGFFAWQFLRRWFGFTVDARMSD